MEEWKSHMWLQSLSVQTPGLEKRINVALQSCIHILAALPQVIKSPFFH